MNDELKNNAGLPGEEPEQSAEIGEQTEIEEVAAPAEESAEENVEAPAAKEESEEHTRVFSVEDLSESGEKKMDGVRLAVQLCRTVMEAVGEDGFHGGIRPDNVSLSGENVTLGSPLEHGVGEFTPQELEYMAPELFWDGKRGATADVYSLGLVLYALYNHGRMPFWPEEGDASPNLRAAALQKRMSREPIPAPAGAGEELGGIILKALAFSAEERWANVGELCAALEGCGETQADPADLAEIAAGMSVRAARPAEKKDEVDSPFVAGLEEDSAPAEEEPIPRVKVRRRHRRLAQAIVYLVLAVSIVAIVLLLRRCAELDDAARVTPTPPTVDAMSPSGEEKVIDGNLTEPTAEPTPQPEETAPAEPEKQVEPIVEYTAYREDVSWTEAVQRCKDMGGTLAMPTNYSEFQQITAACEEKGLTYVWLNARRDESDNWVNADGELAAYFFAWGDGEPSRVDSGDGAAEDYFLLWNMGGRWSGNDSREDPLDGYWTAYTGKIGFVCKTVSYPLADETADTADQSGQEG